MNDKRIIKAKSLALLIWLVFLLYDILFITSLIFYFPVYLWRKKINFGALKEKLGFIALDSKYKNCIWIHVVSVGEAQLIGAFIEKLKQQFSYPIVISTTTLTGNRLAKQKYAKKAKVIYFPYDISIVLSKILNKLSPSFFVAVETEIWPNLFYRLKQKDIPLILINARISNAAFRRYKKIKTIIKPVLNWCNYIAAQNQMYKNRFIELGSDPEKIFITGNMKFESITVDEKHLTRIKDTYGPILKKDNRILIAAASTHDPEEEIILKVYQEIMAASANIALLIAPRHIDRTALIEKNVSSLGFASARISALKEEDAQKQIFLLDTIGELLYFYAICDICFVGGSLIPHGGHNILEPIYFGKPTVFGPSMENFEDIEEIVLNHGAGIKVENAHRLREIMLQLINNAALRKSFAQRCQEVFQEEKKSLDKNMEIISRCLK